MPFVTAWILPTLLRTYHRNMVNRTASVRARELQETRLRTGDRIAKTCALVRDAHKHILMSKERVRRTIGIVTDE